jgi:hypothetical protein
VRRVTCYVRACVRGYCDFAAGGTRVQHPLSGASSALGASTCLPPALAASSTSKLPAALRSAVRQERRQWSSVSERMRRDGCACATTHPAPQIRRGTAPRRARPAAAPPRARARARRATARSSSGATVRARRKRVSGSGGACQLKLGADLLLRRQQRARVAAERLAAHAQQLAVCAGRGAPHAHECPRRGTQPQRSAAQLPLAAS